MGGRNKKMKMEINIKKTKNMIINPKMTKRLRYNQHNMYGRTIRESYSF